MKLRPGHTLDPARQVEQFLDRMDIQSWIGTDAEVKVNIVRQVRDWKKFFTRLGVDPSGGLREDATGIHMWLFFRRKGAK